MEARVESLSADVEAIVSAAEGTNGDDEHDPEGATVAFERARTTALLSQARADLDALDRAEVRLAGGRYEDCARCGQPIGEERLAALPATQTCVGCAGPGGPAVAGQPA